MALTDGLFSYLPPVSGDLPPKRLVVEGGDEDGTEFTFYDRVEMGRFKSDRQTVGRLFVRDSTVSSRHCVITQRPDERCFIRDLSRNGTRVDDRRLSPNLRTEIKVGQVISVGQGQRFRLEGDSPADMLSILEEEDLTLAQSDVAMVTVLVGDIRNYTTMVQDVAPSDLEESVGRVFRRLEHGVLELGGTLKEFQGDAIFAFWEKDSSPDHAVEACRAALRLHGLTKSLGRDSSVWCVDGVPLEMDWALATGPVVMRGYGGEHAVGLAMVGEPVVLAFRIEKLASEGLGHIIACPRTQEMATDVFSFKKLGPRRVKGFEREFELFSLTGEADPA
jgi:class 3 adenylate cyclase